MGKCIKKVCNYEDFAERAENKYGRDTFGKKNWRKKRVEVNPVTVNAFERLYKRCHQNDPSCIRQKQNCKCFRDMVRFLDGEIITTTAVTDQPTPATTTQRQTTTARATTSAPGGTTTTGGTTADGT